MVTTILCCEFVIFRVPIKNVLVKRVECTKVDMLGLDTLCQFIEIFYVITIVCKL